MTCPAAQDDCFVTVFGFQPEHAAEVMREFARCGEILSFGSGREDKVNWVHIQYAVRWPGHSWTLADLCLLSGFV